MKNILPNAYLLGIGVMLLSFFLLLGVRALFSIRIEKWVGRTKNPWDNIVVETIQKTNFLFVTATAIFFGLNFIPHARVIERYTQKIYFIVFMWQFSIWSFTLLDMWISSTIRRRTQKNPATANSISLIQLVFRVILFSLIFLFTLSNLGIKITTIIAGLGVGGIAVALALQKILGDLFSSLSIVLDKPFVVGDFVVLDQYLGTVEKIGLKTTRLRSLSGEQIIISNSDLLASRIRNFKRMHERRLVFQLSLTHSTEPDELKNAVDTISAIIRSKANTRFERCHFMKIAQSSLDIETVYWVLSDDYDLHMNIQQDILMEIRRAFKEDGIQFAYPTSEIHLKNEFRPKMTKENNSDRLSIS